ncbi:MAG: hypothetical protein LBH21_01795, partial [Gracilibacteraceae bacterium]|nr:hypothetical protein [Gracilibacteraceae bacterium]
MSKLFHRNSMILPENRYYLERPRINNLLAKAVQHPYVTVVAGTGYGKTQAVHSFLLAHDATTAWIQLSERDNLNTRFWENFAHTMSLFNKRLATRMFEFGFPDTDIQYAEVLAIPENELSPNEKYVLVFDDFHLLHDPSVLRFMRRILKTPFSNITLVMISRSEPDLSAIPLLVGKGLLFTITEEELRFTEEETAQYFQLLGFSLSSQSMANIFNDTAGWAFALSLVGLSLQKAPAREQIARTAMKLNIFKLIESEVFLVISEELRRFLIKLSLIDHLSTTLVSTLAGDEALVGEIKKVSSFIRYDIYLDAYLIHHLFLDFLRQRQGVLTEEEKRDTYLKAARWCSENDCTMDAVSYYEKAGEYEAIIRIVRSFPLQVPRTQAQFVLDIYDNGPKERLESSVSYHIQHSRLLMSLGRYEETVVELNARIEKYSALPSSDFNNQVLCGAYEALAFTSYLSIPRTDHCDFDKLLEKAAYYYRLSPYEESDAVTSININAWASQVGVTRPGAMEEYIETLTRAVPFVATVLNGCMYGLDDLARGELLFYKNELKPARKCILQALAKAEEGNQYEVRNRAIFYLMRIGTAQGNYDEIQSAFLKLEEQLTMTAYSSRFVTYDIITSWYYSLFNRQFTARWLKEALDNKEAISAFNADFANMIKAQLDYLDKRYHDLLVFLENACTPYTVLFGQLKIKILTAACHYQLKDRKAALAALQDAYELARSNNLV